MPEINGVFKRNRCNMSPAIHAMQSTCWKAQPIKSSTIS